MSAQVVALRPRQTDTQPPSVSVTAPGAGATVSGTGVAVTASASDDVGVAWVQFQVDGVNLGSHVTSPPYQASWDTTQVANGSHVLTAQASDFAGNVATSAGGAGTGAPPPPPAARGRRTPRGRGSGGTEDPQPGETGDDAER